MALESNSSNEEVVAVPKFYTGIGNFRVLAVNPTKEQYSKFGIELQKEPEYRDLEMNGEKKNKIVFLVHNGKAKITTRVELIVSPTIRTNADGNKTQFINKYGNTAWGVTLDDIIENEKMAWFETESAREAYDGEEALINFLKAWANVSPEGKVSLDNPDKVFNGDVSEIKAYAAQLKANEVRLLLGVDDRGDKQYQAVYRKFFGRPYAKDAGFIRSLNGEYGKFDVNYDPNNFTLKEYNAADFASSSLKDAVNGTSSDAEEDFYAD